MGNLWKEGLNLNVLEVKGLHKKLGKREIIKGLDFSIKEGEIFGFLGPNGAGKTTTIRMLVGLISPNKGTISILGYDLKKNRTFALRDVGSVVENPELYTYMSGRQNLMQLARIYGNISKSDIDEIVELVGLKDRINDKVKKYSLGMKQRLGLAEALLPKPRLLVLDEPTNGLDPSGMIEFRNIIKKVAKEKHTAVFISSHILSEIQQLCDTVAFIDDGKIKAIEGVSGESFKIDNSMEELLKDETEAATLITPNTEKAIEIIKSLSYVKDFKLAEDKIHLNLDKGSVSKLVSELVKNDISIEEIYKRQNNLEDRYMEIVEGGTK